MQFYYTFVLVPGARCCVVMLCGPLPALLCSDTLPAARCSFPRQLVQLFGVFGGAWCSVSVNSTQGKPHFFYCRAKFKFASLLLLLLLL